MATVGVPHDGSSRARSSTRSSPCGLQGEEERVGLRIDLDDDEAVPDNRRARGPPLVGRNVVHAHVHAPEIDLPEQRAVDIVRVHALRAERRHDDAAVGGRRLLAYVDFMCRLSMGMPSNATRSQAAVPAVERVEHPFLARPVRGRIAVAVQTGLERRVRIGADGSRDENAIAPDDRTRVREAGNRGPPEDVLPLGGIPVIGQVLPRRRRTPAARGTTASCPRPVQRRAAPGPHRDRCERACAARSRAPRPPGAIRSCPLSSAAACTGLRRRSSSGACLRPGTCSARAARTPAARPAC